MPPIACSAKHYRNAWLSLIFHYKIALLVLMQRMTSMTLLTVSLTQGNFYRLSLGASSGIEERSSPRDKLGVSNDVSRACE